MILRNLYISILLLLSFVSKAQKSDTVFKQEWIGIDTSIIKQDLTKIALEKVNALYQKARQRHLGDQEIKCLIYQFSLQDRITYIDPNPVLKTIEQELMSSSDKVQKAVLHSLLAKLYSQYFNTHRWNLYGRKNTTNIQKADITTWGIDDFMSTISRHFTLSLENSFLLQQNRIDSYDAVIIKGNMPNLRPTLFDLLANEALDYFKSGETYVTKPAYTFSITDEKALGLMDDFIYTTFLTKDSSAQQWIALQIFKQLLSFHRNDIDKNALLEINLERIEWVYRQANFSSKESAYLKALEEIKTQYSSFPAASQAWYLLASEETGKAGKYSPFGDTTNRYAYAKAKQMVETALSIYKENNRGTVNLQNLIIEIDRKELLTQTEQVNIPGKPFRALVSFRNTDTVYGRIIRVKNSEDFSVNKWNNQYWKKLAGLKTYQTFIQPLPANTDHQLHSTEIKIEGLPVGEYLLLCSVNPGFNDSLDKMCVQSFTVSNISYIKNNRDFFVLNRDNGKPMSNVKVTIYRQSNNELKKYTRDIFAEKTSNENGFFGFDEYTNYNSFEYSFSKGNDQLNIRKRDYFFYENNNEEEETDEILRRYENMNNHVYYFTDRSIYRPGQTVYFKGIAVTKDYRTKLSRLITKKDSGWVYLKDVHQKKIDSIKYALNDYGSFNGKFQLPQNGLTGNFSISVTRYNQASTYFSVEEYKRPTFNVSFEKTKGSYRLNDSVSIVGYAKAYAGNNIDGAKVVYNITRTARLLDPWSWRKTFLYTGDREISHGEISTDAEGKFIITFKALAEDITDRAGNPLFNFFISADVTDMTGETRSNNVSVSIGFTSLLLNVSVPALSETDSLTKIQVSSTNLSYEKEPALVQVKIFSLKQPDHSVRKRYWPRPDQFVIGRKEFEASFPTDEYEEESNYRTWTTGEVVMEGAVDTKEKSSFEWGQGILKPGYYRIEAVTRDKYGEEIKNIQYTQLFNAANGQLASPVYQFNYILRGSAQPGQTAAFISSSIADHLFVIRKTDRPGDKTNNYSLTDRNKGVETTYFTPTEKDRGGVSISEAYVFDNRAYIYQYTIDVPWNNKKLQVQYASYRDKTEPGSKENWTVTVQTDKNEKAAAELLTGMYDASLDQFKPQYWNTPNIWGKYYPMGAFTGIMNFNTEEAAENDLPEKSTLLAPIEFDRLATNASELGNRNLTRWLNDSTFFISVSLHQSLKLLNEVVITGYGGQQKKDLLASVHSMALEGKVSGVAVNVDGKKFFGDSLVRLRGLSDSKMEYNASAFQNVNDIDPNTGRANADINQVQLRKNFNETAFFFPQLYADDSGKYSFSFTMPESLTQWKWMSLAHTKDLAFGNYSTNIITQKKLMVQPNAPRFMREGDNMEFSAKIVNLSDKEMTGQVSFELIDATSNTSVDGWFQNVFPSQYFTVDAGQSFPVKFPIQVPFSYNRPLTWRIIAKAGDFSDGEENTLPVLTNRMLVTESLPLFLQNDTTQTFKFDKLLNTTSESLSHEGLTVEYTSNPVWYAVQALPYLMEFPYECAEQTFNHFYANALGSLIVNKHPKIKAVFEKWKTDSISLKSNLQKNEELKQLLLQETPWVLQAESEEQQKKNISLLFDLVKLSNQTEALIEKLSQLQLGDGSFSWFKGGYGDRYMTNYILTGIGKLKRLGALSPEIALRIRTILVNALKFMDSKIAEDYDWLVRNKADLNKVNIYSSQIEYLYMRSFFRDVAQQSPVAYDYYYKQGKQYWIKQNSYYKAELGLIYYRNKDEVFATGTILPALLENAIDNPKLGIYWKSTYAGYWYQSPIEHQSMMIAFMSEIDQNNTDNPHTQKINAMKTWLLLNKQTTNWRTTIATADACYALLLNGSDWLNTERKVSIQLGNYTINSSNEKTEAGTGYFKKRIEGTQVVPEMGNIIVSIKSEVRSTNQSISQSPSWGSVYWQYFEDMDKITAAASPLSINKKLFIERNTDKGKVLDLVKEGDELKTGDKIVIRMELRTDRDMDYLHLKDMRAASMEPVNVLSSYKWQDGLGYYESTKDASSNFFISHLSKGTYVFEYPVFITHTGIFSVGIATIQCMYAPEFTSHSEGIKIRVGN